MKKLLVGGLGEGYGGVSNVIMSFLRNITPQQLDVTVIETYDSVYRDEISDLGFKIVKLPVFKKYFKYKKAVKKLFKENSFDVVWINNTAKVDLLLMKYAKRAGAKVISHSHGSVQEGSRLKKFVFEVINKLHEKKFYDYIDLGVACSQSSAEYFYNEKYSKGKSAVVLSNAIDCKKYAFSVDKRAEARAIFGVQDGDTVLACIGRVCAVKNLGFALKTLKLLPQNYKLIIVGGGEISELNNSIKEFGLDGRVKVLGERGDVDLLINGIDILLLPSLSEGLPMITVEAQANGTKCIISDRVSTECKALDSAEFISIQDENEWAEAILKADVTKNEKAVEILLSKGFDISAYARKLMELIYNV